MTAFRSCSRLALFAAALCITGCAGTPDPELVPDQPVRNAPPVGSIAPGDCPEALRRAAADPELYVDRLAEPKAMVPAPIPVRSMPAAVRRAKYSEVRVSVMVDTLGRADMSTFKVLTSTHPWLGTSVKSAVAKWTFVPAQVAGCKVPRSWKWGVTAGKPPRA